MPELTDAQKVMRNDTGKSIAEAIANMSITVAGQEIEVSDTEPQSKFVDVWFQEQQQGTPVEVYTVPEIDGMRTKMESNLAYVNTGSAADKTYYKGDYLVYNGQLYKVGNTAIGPGETLTVGGNIEAVDGGLNDLNTAIANKTACKRIIITSTSEYIVSIGGILCGDVLFVDAVISKDLPSGGYQNLAISLPNSTEGRGIIYPTNYTGSPQSSQPTGSFSFGSARDSDIIGSCRISNTVIAICISAAPNANFFVSFCVAYPKIGSV